MKTPMNIKTEKNKINDYLFHVQIKRNGSWITKKTFKMHHAAKIIANSREFAYGECRIHKQPNGEI